MNSSAIVYFTQTLSKYLPALPELPENCKRAKAYVEENGQKLFFHLKSDQGKAECRLFTKVYLSTLVGSQIGHLSRGIPGAIVGSLIPCCFYLSTECDKEWFNFDKLSSQFKTLIKTIIASKVLQICVAAIGISALIATKKIESIDELKGQVTFEETIKEAVEKGLKKQVYFVYGFIIPLLDQITFSGFLTDGIYTLQRKWDASTINSTTQKATRIAFQALVFGAAHYISSHGVSNYLIIPQSAVIGLACGYLMEKTSNIAMPIFLSGASNFLAVSLMMRK